MRLQHAGVSFHTQDLNSDVCCSNNIWYGTSAPFAQASSRGGACTVQSENLCTPMLVNHLQNSCRTVSETKIVLVFFTDWSIAQLGTVLFGGLFFFFALNFAPTLQNPQLSLAS